MFKVLFPGHTNQRYYHIHYQYVKNIFKYLKCDITEYEAEDFIVKIDGKSFLFDFWDQALVRESDLPTFKFHCEEETDQVFAFPPVSFYDWDQYYQLEKEIKYNPLAGFDISSRQRPYAGALERRTFVQKMLSEAIAYQTEAGQYEAGQEPKLLLSQIDQVEYWKEINKIDVAVFVPGHHNNMMDRAHLQYLAFGAYTISPHIPDLLPFGKKYVPKKHYVECADDYSNLLNLIEVKKYFPHVKNFVEISENAKKLFKETCTPEAIGKWISTKL